MPASLFTDAQATVPQFGVIVGGLMDGWSFAYVGVGLRPDGEFYIDLRANPGKWPFPKLIRFRKGDYLSLTPGVEANVSAPCYELKKLIEAAMAVTGKK